MKSPDVGVPYRSVEGLRGMCWAVKKLATRYRFGMMLAKGSVITDVRVLHATTQWTVACSILVLGTN